MKLKWKEEAVSPVIATILMVAITVVLAAVLYVMVIGMGGGAISRAPVGSWNNMVGESNSTGRLSFGNFQPEVRFMEIKLIIEIQNGTVFSVWWSSTVTTENYTLECDHPTITAYYYDLNPDGGTIGSGDHVMLYGLEPFTYYNVRVYHYPSDSVVDMVGKTSFQTAP